MIDDDDVGFGGALTHERDEAVAMPRAFRAKARVSASAAMSFQSGRSSGRSRSSARSPVAVCFAHGSMHRQHHAVAAVDEPARGRRASVHPVAVGLESMQAEVVRPSLHQRRRERHVQRVPQRREVLEEDLFLEVLRACGDEHALRLRMAGIR